MLQLCLQKIVAIILLLYCNYFIAQTYNFRLIDENRGLTEKYINHISQSKSGVLLLSSEEGFLRYDGTDFIKNSSLKKLHDEFITAHLSNRRGKIYLGTQAGSLYKIVSNDSVVLLGKIDFSITKIIEISDSLLLIGTKGNGLWLSASDGLKKITSVTSTLINDIEFVNNFVYVVGENGIEICTISNEYVLRIKGVDKFNFKNVLSTCILSGDSMLLAVEDEGLFLLKDTNGTNKITRLDKISELITSKVTSIIKSKTGDIWISTRGNGLFKLSTQPNSSTFTINQINSLNGLPSNNIECVYEDNYGGFWFGTYGTGLIHLTDPSIIKYHVTQNLSSPDNSISCFETYSKYEYIVGTSKGLYLYRPKVSSVTFFKKNKQLETEAINCLYMDEDSILWIGTENKGIFAYNKIENKWISEYSINKTITSITGNKKKKIFIGTNEGIYIVDKEANGFKRYTTNEGLAHNNILKLYSDSKEKLWIACNQSGLQCLENNEIKLYKDIKGLKSFDISSICEDEDGNVWFCTKGDGVFKYNGTAFFQYTTKQGLASNFCSGLVGINNGSLFAFHKNNYSTLKLSGTNFIPSTKEENDFIGEIIQNSFYYDQNFGLLLGTGSGFIIKTNKKLYFKRQEIVINSLLIDNVERTQLEDIILPYNDYEFKINFSGIFFSSPEKIKYKYRLLGYDVDWNIGDFKFKSVTYKKLPEGDYTFQVQAIVEGNASSTIEEVKIIIEKPFWKTWWFILLCVGTLFTIVISYIRIRTKSLIKRTINLEKTVKDRTIDLQTKNSELEITQHELAEKNKDITDSITFAKRIQEAILPSDLDLTDGLENHFVLYIPRDIVSGDFYWHYRKNDSFYFAVVDSMGHGVSGAFMSMIGGTLLSKIAHQSNNLVPSEILNDLDKEIIASLKQLENKTEESMDVALIEINAKSNSMIFCGAKRSLIHIRDSQLTEYSGDKFSVGGFYTGIKKTFTTESIDIIKNDMIYMFSDGLADQFGSNNKKFTSKKLKELLIKISAEDTDSQKKIIQNTLAEWQGNAPQTDDILITGIRI
jgi:ligand-binding sensor domain-containing protein/serine phosphatase RsbU (regulator of sigma subunit)